MDYKNKDIIDKVEKIAEAILSEKHSNHHRDRFFPELINRMNYKIGAEIGVDKGDFSEHILSKTQIEMYYGIDTWQDDFGSNHKPDYFDKEGNVRLNQALEKLSPYVLNSRVILLRMEGLQASKKFEEETIDFCYIDGDHSLGGIYNDVVAWTPKVKIGGIIAGHDYKDGPRSGISDYFGEQLDYKIKTVVDYYCQRYGHKLNVIGGRILSWYFVKNTSSDDIFGKLINE